MYTNISRLFKDIFFKWAPSLLHREMNYNLCLTYLVVAFTPLEFHVPKNVLFQSVGFPLPLGVSH